ncbi:unnamed protein product [Absidia cylindrospora]
MSSHDDHFTSPHHERRNAISIPRRKSSLTHPYPTFDGKTTVTLPPLPIMPCEAQMNKMKQLIRTAIHQLRTLAGQLVDAEANATHWQKEYADLDARYTDLLSAHHETSVALKTTRQLLLSSRRERLEHRLG